MIRALPLFGLQGGLSDHLVRAWHHTFGLPVVAEQLFQQLRPLAVSGKTDPASDHVCAGSAPLPVYGNGENIRDWLHAFP